jgi:cytochrome c
MRRLAPALAAAVLAATLAGCGKSDTNKQADASQATSTAQPAAEPSDADKKAIVAALPAPYNAADLANGEAQFGLCKSCHTTVAGGPNMTGPHLHGVIGTKAATQPADFKYSDALKAANLTWDLPTLDRWITDPKALVPNTKMTFAGLKDPNARRDAIAYLAAETSAPPK